MCQNVSFQLVPRASVYVGSAASTHLLRKVPGARSTTAGAHLIGTQAAAVSLCVVRAFEGCFPRLAGEGFLCPRIISLSTTLVPMVSMVPMVLLRLCSLIPPASTAPRPRFSSLP